MKQFQITQQLLADIHTYIDDRYIEPDYDLPCFGSAPDALFEMDSLDDLLESNEATFSEALLELVDSRNLTDPEVYRRAHIDRKLFSKIRSNALYQPKKATAIALALALHLNPDETLDLIGRAGFTLTTSSKSDLVIMYFIEHSCWDIDLINQVLYHFDLPLLGH